VATAQSAEQQSAVAPDPIQQSRSERNAAPTPTGTYTPTDGPWQVAIAYGDWTDPNRNDRLVPWKLYLPEDFDGPFPVVLWSHGAGGSRDGAEYLGRHLASHGYAALHLQHLGSDVDVLRRAGVQGMLREVAGVEPSAQRFGDIRFAVDQLHAMNASGPFTGRFAVERIGISGHSFGAITVQVAAGQRFAGVDLDFSEPRLRGGFAMSPSPPRRGSPEAAFADMLFPIFHLTGTHDETPTADFEPASRLVPFQVIDDVDQYLLVLDGAVHATFGGRQIAEDRELERHHEVVKMAALAWWDMLLREDASAREWLEGGGFAEELVEGDRWEVKRGR
jgi:dienelactone hydrolase